MNQPPVYQLKIFLQHIRPTVWRRLWVSSHYTLKALHNVIQCAMGWQDKYLYSFEDNGAAFKSHLNRSLMALDVNVNDTLHYLYDFEDKWAHGIHVEKQLTVKEAQPYPYCVTGKHQCPPEDSGGVWGYQQLLAVLANKRHPEHETMRTRVGKDFDPAHFDREAINDRLQTLSFS